MHLEFMVISSSSKLESKCLSTFIVEEDEDNDGEVNFATLTIFFKNNKELNLSSIKPKNSQATN